jgi:hypothetical protein
MLPIVKANAVNDLELTRVEQLESRVTALIGKPSFKQKSMIGAAHLLSKYWNLRLKLVGDAIQPKTIFTTFKHADRQQGKMPIKSFEVTERLPEALKNFNKAACISLD